MLENKKNNSLSDRLTKKVGESKVNKKNIIYRISSLCAEREKKLKNGLEISSF
jgi:hypothetical protein